MVRLKDKSIRLGSVTALSDGKLAVKILPPVKKEQCRKGMEATTAGRPWTLAGVEARSWGCIARLDMPCISHFVDWTSGVQIKAKIDLFRA